MKNVIKKSLCLVISMTLLLLSLTGCNTTDINSLISDTVDQTKAFDQYLQSFRKNISEQNDSQKLPMDPTVMTPWINSNIYGMVTDDINADLKDDFYLNINHDQLRDAKFRPGYSSESYFNKASDITKERCMEMLTDKELLNSEDPEIAFNASLIQGLYDLYLDWDQRNEAGVEPFRSQVEHIISIESLPELTEYMLSKENLFFGLFPVPIVYGVDQNDSSRYNVLVKPSPLLTYNDSAEYRKETAHGKQKKEYSDAVFLYMTERFGIERAEAEKYLKNAYSLEEQLAESEKSVLEQSSPDALKESINPVTMDDIKNMSPDFPLAEYMERYRYAESELINVNEPEALHKINLLYNEEHLDEFKAYLLKGLLDRIIDVLDRDAFDKAQELERKRDGIAQSKTDEEEAYSLAMTFFPVSFEKIYLKKYLNEDMRQEITTLCEDCIAIYKDMLSETEWLSDQTKEKAIKKLENMVIHAVYPDKWLDNSMFSITPKEEGGTLLDGLVSYQEGTLILGSTYYLNGKVDPDIWLINILTNNAFYTPADNSINIIPGFFSDETYSSDMSIEEKLGTLGSFIGHEISHAFDTTGAQYDESGNVVNWWTDEDYAAFMERADKLVKFYDNIIAYDDGTPISGQLVKGEAIADMAGVKCMLKMAESIEDFDYDKFFRANARIWFRVDTLEASQSFAVSNPHPSQYLRVNVTLQQFDEFLETYDIKPGDGMYLAPEDRINVW
ncbi:MAG: M13 family metallopeptidase [Lachnospiraceae bacterium]|nr:M13 family metallopeptidase [Lachnospiraceae bacterium]